MSIKLKAFTNIFSWFTWKAAFLPPALPAPLRRLLNLFPLVLLLVCSCAHSFKTKKVIKDYACYYGYGRLEELAEYDLVIVQPSAYNPEDIALLRSRGCLVLAYLSVGEDDSLTRDNGRGVGGYAPWYLDEFTGPGLDKPGADGQPDQNAEWKSYYVDSGHPRWRAHLKGKIQEFRTKYGFDGFFLDTALTPKNAFTKATEARLESGMLKLLKNIRRWSKGGYVLINNGWRDLETLGPVMDGVLLENFTSSSDDEQEREHHLGESERIARHLNHYRKSHGFGWDVFTLDYLPRKKISGSAWQRPRSFGFIPAVYENSPEGLNLKTFPIKEIQK